MMRNDFLPFILTHIIFPVVLLFFFISTCVYASEIKLLSGRTFEGEIVRRDDEKIKVDRGFDVIMTYYMEEIDLIDGKPVRMAEKESDQVSIPEMENDITQAVESGEPAERTETVVKVEPSPANDLEKPAQGSKTVKEIASVRENASIEVLDPITMQDVVQKAQARNQTELTRKTAPIKDIAVVDRQNLSKEIASPFGPKIAKTKIVSGDDRFKDRKKLQSSPGQRIIHKSEKKEIENLKGSNPTWIEKARLFMNQKIDYVKKYKIQFQKRLPFIKEKLEQIPIKVRKDILIVGSSFLALLYIFICFPFMLIAKKLKKKQIWLVWIPIVQVFYFVYMSDKSLWWSLFFVVPIVHLLLPFVLFASLLRALRRPSWLVILTVIPVINIFMIWYLALAKITDV